MLSLNASQEVTDFGSIIDPGVSILGETVKDLMLLHLHADKPFEVPDKISTSLVECERVKPKIGKTLRADGSPRVWKKFPPARGQKGFLS